LLKFIPEATELAGPTMPLSGENGMDFNAL
jgi:hypothetical protein